MEISKYLAYFEAWHKWIVHTSIGVRQHLKATSRHENIMRI